MVIQELVRYRNWCFDWFKIGRALDPSYLQFASMALWMVFCLPRSHTSTLCLHQKLHALQIVAPHAVFLAHQDPTLVPYVPHKND